MKHYFTLVSLAFLIVLSSGCEDRKEEVNVLFDIEDDFSIGLWETLDPTNPALELEVQSLEPLECLNYNLEYSVQENGNKIIISLDEFLPPNDCIDGSDYFQTNIEIGALETGFYDVEVNIKEEIINNGQLVVGTQRYDLNMSTDVGFTFGRTALQRVQRNMFWGYVQTENPMVEQLFLNEINRISLTQPYHKGDYGHFRLNDDNSLSIHEMDEATFTFLRSLNIPEDELQEMVATLRSDYPEATFQFFTASGLML